jgi:class 3 adenylate cyclase/ActR/RegA family two-component response regulator
MADEPERARGSLLHELRTPLTQIIGYSEMLAEEAEDRGDGATRETLRTIAQAGRRLSRMLETAFGAGSGDAVAEAQAPVVAASAPAPGPATGEILVVDDNELNRDMLSRRLRSRGYAVTVAEDGARALERVASGSFDLVLLDIMMPGLSGIDVLQRLRERYSREELPVIMATARDQADDVVEALKAGANDYVTKPLDFPVVLARTELQILLRRSSAEIRRLAAGLEKRNQFIRDAFGRYLNDEVVEGLLDGASGLALGGETRVVTILMSDLRGFTTVTEGLAPEVVVSMLNSYLEAMVEVITRHGGTIDEFIGDAILVLFGAPVARPDAARRAVACAVEMQNAMLEINQRFHREWLPELEMGIAINTGAVVVGNIGSAKRAKYGVVGTHVNLVGRMQSFAVGGQVLVSRGTLDAAGPDVLVGKALAIQAKGFRDPIEVYDLRGTTGPGAQSIPERSSAVRTLESEIAVRYTIVDDKALGGPVLAGALLAVGDGIATLRPGRPLRLFTELHLRVVGAGGHDLQGDVYAKVTETPGDETVSIRFTALPAAIRRYLREA